MIKLHRYEGSVIVRAAYVCVLLMVISINAGHYSSLCTARKASENGTRFITKPIGNRRQSLERAPEVPSFPKVGLNAKVGGQPSHY